MISSRFTYKILAGWFLSLLTMNSAYAFCGFYVAKADVTLTNKTSQVIFVRDGNHSIITMANDFKGDVDDFAMVVPVPEVLKRDQIRISENRLFQVMNDYSGPRLSEYHDPNPGCPYPYANYDGLVITDKLLESEMLFCAPTSASMVMAGSTVRVHAKYKVEEYEIVILSSEKSSDLQKWLLRNNYKIPEGAEEVLEPYIRNDMKFFVVKANKEMLKRRPDGSYDLRPIQIEFHSDKFMLPIRLGMANASEPQDLLVYLLTKKGRVETVNYQTVPVHGDLGIPQTIKTQGKFSPFYQAVFDQQWAEEGKNDVFLEYSWDLGGNIPVKCDPCVGTPPMVADLQKTGVDWLKQNGWQYTGDLYFTRLHARYDRKHFPQDLVFQETPNREKHQARFYIHNPPANSYWDCEKGQAYLHELRKRRNIEVATLENLTGWDRSEYQAYINEYDRFLLSEDENEAQKGFLPITLPDGPSGPWGPAFLIMMIGVLLLLVLLSISQTSGLLQRTKISWRLLSVFAVLILGGNGNLFAFCGFYVAKADGRLTNKTSEVIIARDGDHTVITMSNDFQGDIRDFAMVVPVPEVLQRNSIRVKEKYIFSRFNEYSGPRLVEYFDPEPCPQPLMDEIIGLADDAFVWDVAEDAAPAMEFEAVTGVEVEAVYQVDEYDVVILSANESAGLEKWLTSNGYKIPVGAQEVLQPYIRNNLKFFVVKVNLTRHDQLGFQALRPIQIEFNSDKFMLPIRLGMANADGDQDMIVYALSKTGRIEVANYQTLTVPTNNNIPTFVENDFGKFYGDVFQRTWSKNGKNDVFLEYAWDVSVPVGVKCDPCVGNPPTQWDLTEAGAFWLQAEGINAPVFFTRLHVRYNRANFPQDLMFQQTPNKERFQGRYVMNQAANGPFECREGQLYLRKLIQRHEEELVELHRITGWPTLAYREAYINRWWRKCQPLDDTDPVKDDSRGDLRDLQDERDKHSFRASVDPIQTAPGSNSKLQMFMFSLVALCGVGMIGWMNRRRDD